MKMIVMIMGIVVEMKIIERMTRGLRGIGSRESTNPRRFIGLEPCFQMKEKALRGWRDLFVALYCLLRSGRNGCSRVGRDKVPKSG